MYALRAEYKDFYGKYLDRELKLEKWQKIGIFLLMIVIAGVIGWVWEFALTEVRHGFQDLYIKGGNILPWMNIYAYGSILIIALTYKLRKNPLAVFSLSALGCGVLEWLGGWLALTIWNARYWDYREDWFGIGTLDGFACPASIILFGAAALMLVYQIYPRVIFKLSKIDKKKLLAVATAVFAIFMLDDVINLTLKNFELPTAHDFYHALGWKFENED